MAAFITLVASLNGLTLCTPQALLASGWGSAPPAGSASTRGWSSLLAPSPLNRSFFLVCCSPGAAQVSGEGLRAEAAKQTSLQDSRQRAAQTQLECGAEAAQGQAVVVGVGLISCASVPAASGLCAPVSGPGVASPGWQRVSGTVGGRGWRSERAGVGRREGGSKSYVKPAPIQALWVHLALQGIQDPEP